MARWTMRLATAVAATALAGCGMLGQGGGDGWTTLVHGARGLENFERVGEADWTAVDGAIQATRGGGTPAYLVTRRDYRDFEMRVEFWASDDANSGVFMRCVDRSKIGDETCYEANIFDQRPDQTYATGSIVKVAPVAQPAPRAGGRWNTFEITMRGPRLQVALNGAKTVDVVDARFAEGPIALQWGRGTVRFRDVRIRPL